MWTAETRRTYDRKDLRYPTDMTDAEWDLARPFVDVAQSRSGQRRVDLREVLNAVFYILGTGCQWRAVPKDLPPRSTVHDYFVRWQSPGHSAHLGQDVVYVRQSTPAQVQFNLESQRQQYELVEVARRRGFDAVEIIDDDLGKSASGMVARPGFERLVASLCAGHVGAVLCLDASRLARNGRDWHHLLELCGLVEARVIDLEGVYDPGRPNDRLLLGMKGSISEFELGVLRTRMLEAARAKARRGELRISVPIGYVWHRDLGLGFDPDLRIQEAIRQIFQRFQQLGSARSVHLAMAADQVHFPRPSDGQKLVTFDWAPIRYRNVISVLKNPFYAGAYAYGKSEKRIEIVEGRARKSYGHGRPLEEWEVLLKDHHEGYIDWGEFDRNQAQLASNAYGLVGGPKSGRGGSALLSGLLTCGRCGRRLAVAYTG